MKFKKELSAFVAVAMMIGCMPGFVLAIETDESQTPTEQTTEVQEDEDLNVDPVVDEVSDEEIEVTEESFEDSDFYSVDPANLEDRTVVSISNWDELVSNLSAPQDECFYQLTADIAAPSYGARIDIDSLEYTLFTLDMNGHTIDMSGARSENSSLFFLYPRINMTIMNGTITGGHSEYAGAITNEGKLYLSNVTITGNTGAYGALYSRNGHLYLLDNVTITNNTSTSSSIDGRGAGVFAGGRFDVMGTIIIRDNYRVESNVSYPDNLFLTASSVIVLYEFAGISSDSDIHVDKVGLPCAITVGWNGASNYDVFHFDNGMVTELHEINGSIEVCGALHYLDRSWDAEHEVVVETPYSIYDPSIASVHLGIPADASTISGTYYINRNQEVNNRLYVRENSTLNIILADGVTLNCIYGIGVPGNSSLNIYTQSDDSGTLIAGAATNCAGLGGSAELECGEIKVYGGTIIATGNHGAGIGIGSSGVRCNTIAFYGGDVTATGTYDSPDIGISRGDNPAPIYFYGGRIELSATTSPHTNFTPYLYNMCVMNTEGYYYSTSNRSVLWIGGNNVTLIVCPCPHTSGTCNTEGCDGNHHNFVCGYCGRSEVQLHTFEDGVCACGAGASAVAPQFVGHSMQISGEIGLQFFFTLPDNTTDYYVTFQGNNIDSTRVYTPVTSTKPGTDETYYMVQLNVSSIQLADRFTPILHYTLNGESQEFTGAPYCVMDYINWGSDEQNASTTPEEKAMLRVLADYGYYSQLYMSAQNGWTYGVDYAAINLGRQPIGQDWDGTRTNTYPYRFVANVQSAVFESVTFSMRFGDTLTLRVYFDPADGATININDFNVDCDYNHSISQLSDGRYAVTITGIPARNADYTTYITYQGMDSNRVDVSPLSYVYAMMCQEDDHAAGKYLVCALVNYARACGMSIPTVSN